MLKLKQLRETVTSLGIKPHPLTNEGDYKNSDFFKPRKLQGSTDLYDVLKTQYTPHT